MGKCRQRARMMVPLNCDGSHIAHRRFHPGKHRFALYTSARYDKPGRADGKERLSNDGESRDLSSGRRRERSAPRVAAQWEPRTPA
ncbi:hypothetical protein BD414DRAFT_474228, partial [Trametes punicea]